MADWKYVMIKSGDHSYPIIFPNALIHSHVAGAMKMVLDTLDPKKDLRPRQLESMLENPNHQVTGAGFLNLAVTSTFGMSESLGLNSHEQDAAIINMWPYAQGLDQDLGNDLMETVLLTRFSEMMLEKLSKRMRD